MSRSSPRPHTKLVCTLHRCLSTLLPSGYIVGSFPAPVEEEVERKGRICGCVLAGEVWTLVLRHQNDLCWHLVHLGSDVRVSNKSVGTRCIYGIGRGSAVQKLVVSRVQYTYPYSPPPRYLFSNKKRLSCTVVLYVVRNTTAG